MDVGNGDHNSASGNSSSGTCKERDEEIPPKHPRQHPHQIPTEKTEDHTAWHISHPKKRFICQIDF